MSRLGAAVWGVVILSGCTYYNTLYNARRLYDEAEAMRRTGRDSIATARYRDVVRKTSEAYRGRDSTEEAPEILLLLGKSQLRLGQPREARAALARAAAGADARLRPEVLVYQAAASARLGENDVARRLLEEAFEGGLSGAPLGEAFLLRGHLGLTAASTAAGWEDLQLAGAADPAIAVEAGVERLRQGVLRRDLDRARTALAALLSVREGGERSDTISALVRAAAEQWSPSVAATMLGDVESTAWDRGARGRMQLEQARLFYASGDTASAEAAAWAVARGRGESMAPARVLLAQWRLDRTRDLGEAQSVLSILLPAGDDPGVANMVAAVDELEAYSGVGLDQPLGLFAAAELARDRLEAPILARGLFLAYADSDPEDPWAPKALLAALDVSQDPEDRSWLLGRLEAHADSPYVQAARGRSADGFEALEEELRERLSEIATR